MGSVLENSMTWCRLSQMAVEDFSRLFLSKGIWSSLGMEFFSLPFSGLKHLSRALKLNKEVEKSYYRISFIHVHTRSLVFGVE